MTLSKPQIKFFADFIQTELGIVYTEPNYYQLEKRLDDVAKALSLPSSIDLHTQAIQGIAGSLKQLLLNIATNNETSFFRDPKVFQIFENFVLPGLKKNNPKALLYRIWSAASSFGQEPYSIAMAVSEFQAKNPGHPRFEILATDIADHALAKAKTGVYSQLEVQRGLAAPRLVKYFKNSEDTSWALQHEIKSMVRFDKLNLLSPFTGLGSFDVIFCRYVLIYQDVAKKKEIMAKLAKCLNPGGFLVLGASESVMGLSDEFNQISEGGAILYQKK